VPEEGLGGSASDLDLPSSGIELARAYHAEVVGPLLEDRFPGLPYAAARLGSGSDMLGFDDEQSRDHDWGLRLTLLVGADTDGASSLAAEVDAYLEHALPQAWRGLPTRFATTWEPTVRQRCETASAGDFAVSRLGVDPSRGMRLADWLQLTGQAILEVTAGAVFLDRTGGITRIREVLEWYPHDVWLYALACDWSRLGQEFPDVGRAGLRGGEDGSAVIAARHVRTMMHLAHLLHRRWPPYGKWLARSAAGLPGGENLREGWQRVLGAQRWRERQDALSRAAEDLARIQGEVGLPTLDPVTGTFFDRPHVGVKEMPELLLEEVTDPEVRGLSYGLGTSEQISDNVKALVDAGVRLRLVGG
jgi:hypothetical protein